MSRGAQRTTRALTDQQLAQQNQLISQTDQQGQQDRAQMMPTITSLLNSQGYTPQQQSAITQQSLGAANTALTPFASAPPIVSPPPTIVRATATSSHNLAASRLKRMPARPSRTKSRSQISSSKNSSLA
ncbi:MAG TPA: hypothetical protein VHX36_06705 [Candidatus Acidoferrales bacterium]|jgi:hypothetical protein|nr:hypothetical protein [Candidatus Acidoferrales bacterium]